MGSNGRMLPVGLAAVLGLAGCVQPQISTSDGNVFCWAEANRVVMPEDKWMRPPGVVCTPVLAMEIARPGPGSPSSPGTPSNPGGPSTPGTPSNPGGPSGSGGVAVAASASPGNVSTSVVGPDGVAGSSAGTNGTAAVSLSGDDLAAASAGQGNTSVAADGYAVSAGNGSVSISYSGGG